LAEKTGFNPRPRAGGDLQTGWPWRVVQVSIHAPVRGATQVFLVQAELLKRFNPRPRAGGDPRGGEII